MRNTHKAKTSKVLALLLAVTMVVTMAACGEKEPESTSESMIDGSTSSSTSISSTSSVPPATTSSESQTTSSSSEASSSTSGGITIQEETRTPAQIQTQMLKDMVELNKKNDEIIGWLYIPGTTINQPVVHTFDNEYYLRRDYLGNSEYNGSYFMDCRGESGSRDGISMNSVIYGHSLSDDKNGLDFSQLKKYLDPAFAKSHQFIYFSTPESEMVWQIFANFYANTSFVYNDPTSDAATRLNIINRARQGSQINFGTTVSATDKILTLSTCTYNYDKNYPNDYRYVVMAKLLPKGGTLTPATAEVNPTPKGPDA